jgi:alpha(1,3/1,4) fucosyltransferase
VQLKDRFETQGIEVHTADGLPQVEGEAPLDYYSFGVLSRFRQLAQRKDVSMRAFVIFEPPVVDPRLYRALPELTAAFERVYVHNVHGDGYSLQGVDVSRLRKLYWPQPRFDVMEPFWSNRERLQRLVVINGNHRPQKVPHELYSQRIEAMAALAPADCIDLYGRGWSRWWSRTSMWLPYWKHRRALMSIYKGACDSKYEVLSRYQFCLCLENMAMQGYVTEKLFDCLYAGTVPLYLGATDIAEFVPSDAYIDCRQFNSWKELHTAVKTLSAVQIQHIREAGRAFIKSHAYGKYYGGLLPVFGIESAK